MAQRGAATRRFSHMGMGRQEILDRIRELKERKEKAEFDAKLQDVFQHSFKIMLNSVYGFTGTKFSPVFNRDIAESVTLTGQNVIKEMVQFTNRCLNKIGKDEAPKEWVIAGDTDSVAPETRISLDGRDISISEAFEAVKGHVDVLENGTEVAIPDRAFMTSSVNGETIVRNISRHKAKKQMYHVMVPGHDTLTMTCDESIMVQRGGEIVECRPGEIKETDFIVVKRQGPATAHSSERKINKIKHKSSKPDNGQQI